MLRGLFEKNVREVWRVVAITCVALGAAMGLLVRILPQFDEGLNEIMLQIPFVRVIISGLMGIDVSSGLAPQMLLVIVWSHPIVLAIVWGTAVVLSTRVPAAEIERGTIDVLMSWPVSRSAVYLSETIVCVCAGVLLLLSGALGFLVSGSTLPAELRPNALNTTLTVVNLFALYLAIVGTVQCITAACDRRGKAMGIAIAFLLASFLVSFLSTLWPPAERIVFASIVHYYRPAQVMLTGRLPVWDVVVLVIWGTCLWVIGGVIWNRRSVLTV